MRSIGSSWRSPDTGCERQVSARRPCGPTSNGEQKMRVGFIVTVPYHLFHYREIRRHLNCQVIVYVEVRDEDLGVTNDLIRMHIPDAAIKWVRSADLKKIDGECDVLVCQTPVPLMKFFRKSRLVAEQYSLAKEQYQYGLWRAQANLNLMYGKYSLSRVEKFSTAVLAGNPLFDGHVPAGGLRPADPPRDGRLRVLYMPTYGDLSDKSSILENLLRQDIDLSIKAHHMDSAIRVLAEERGIPLFLSDVNPVELIAATDLVVSDYSGAIYDALAMRKPVVLADSFNSASADAERLSGDDLSRSAVMDLAALWSFDEPIAAAWERSREKLGDDGSYGAFIDKFYANFGCAGKACAEHIGVLAACGEPEDFAVLQIRSAVRRYVSKNRELSRKLKASKAAAKKQVASLKKAARRNGKARANGVAAQPPREARWAARWTIARHDGVKVTLLKGIRALLLALPGGGRMLDVLRSLRPRRATEPAPAGAEHGLVDLTVQEPALPVEGLQLSAVPHRRRMEMLEQMSGFFRQGGLDFRAFASPTNAYIAVRDQEIDRLHRLLASMPDEWADRIVFWLGKKADYSQTRKPGTLALSDLVLCDSLVAGVPLASGLFDIRREGGVEILLLEPRNNRLVSKRARAEKFDWTKDFQGQDQGREGSGVPSPVIRVTSQEEAVDVVYTWVDSSDPVWRQSLAEWSGQSVAVMESASNEERYINRDELKYSLRSVWLYAPFVRNIYIVTAGQRPPWLDPSAENVHIVDHRDIFPDPAALPTFNSHSIEACLHRIPGLAEHFLYFNDDFFIGREVQKETFYTKNGMIKSRFSPSSFVSAMEPAADAIPTDWASYNAVSLMREDYGHVFDRKLKHVPYAMRKSMLEEMEARYPHVFEQTRHSRFRSHGDYSIPAMLAHYYGIATGKAVEWENVPNEYAYADTGRTDFSARLKLIGSKNPTFFCLNVTKHDDLDHATQAILMRDYLDQRYPVRSPFEVDVD